MAYCTYSDIQQKLQNITLDATSDPSTAEVTEFCDQVSADMDAKMNAVGVATPVTDSEKLKVLKRISTNGVLAEVYRSINAEDEASERYQVLYDKAMGDIMKSPDIMGTAVNEESPSHGFGEPSARYSRTGEPW